MADKLPEEMIYTITSGFYPQLFSSDAKWKRGSGGTGRKGMQWRGVKGYNKGSIDNVISKMGGKEFGVMGTGKGTLSHFFGRMRGGRDWMTAFEELKYGRKPTEGDKGFAPNPEGAELVETRRKELGMSGMSDDEMKKNLTYSKFMGNNEMFKLWGTKVWWQEAQRQKPKDIESDLSLWLKEKHSKDLPLYLETLYKNKETFLIKLAQDMAKDVFGKALNKDNLRTDLESVGEEAHVPEEERKEAQQDKRRTKKGITKEVDSIEKSWSDISQARGLDIKYRMRNGTTLYMDSTEVSISETGSHGIVGSEELEALRKTISEAKKHGGDEWMGKLRNSVEKLFIKNISIYNSTIEDLLTDAEHKMDVPKKQGLKSFKELLSKITKKNKKEQAEAKNKGLPYDGSKNVKAAVPDLAKLMGINLETDTTQATALKFITHTIVNLAGSVDKFRQGHLVGVVDGSNVYASIPMQLKNTSQGMIAFDDSLIRNVPLPDGVNILQSTSHLAGIMQKDQTLSTGKVRETQARQTQAFMNGKITGINAKGQCEAQTNAVFDLKHKNVRQTTTVVFNPKKGEAIFKLIEESIKENLSEDQIKTNAENYLSNKAQGKHHLSDKEFKSTKHDTKFWALPYIGVMEYPTKAKE